MTTESSPNMKQRQAADYLGVSIRFLQLRDRDGTGPRSIKLGRLRRYRREDLDAWLLAHREPNGAAA